MLDFGTFNGLVGHKVTARSETHGSVLLEVTEVEQAAGDRPDNAFSVLFKGPSEPFLEQMTHEIDLGASGSHPVFLVPVNQHSDGFEYEAVFTALAES